MKRVVHTIHSVDPAKGGPSRTVPRLCHELATDGRWQPVMVTTDTRPPSEHRFAAQGPVQGSFLRAIRESLTTGAPGPRLLHDHGVWLQSNAFAALQAWRSGVPLVVSPRGMLEPWALGHRAWKKRLALALYQRPLLNTAAGLHATSEEEAANIRALGLRQPIAVIANGVDAPTLPARRPAARRTALFLSRLNVKKGLLPLLEAWAQLRPVDWQLQLVGPDEGGYAQVVDAAIGRLGLREHVQQLPEADDTEKWQIYRDADLFVLPSFSENFGVVVAEALAAGLPVITTTGMPWSGVLDHACGWRIEPTVEQIVAALHEATGLPPQALRAMGERGRAWMAQAYGWPAIAAAMATFYDWLLGGARTADAPAFVRLHAPAATR